MHATIDSFLNAVLKSMTWQEWIAAVTGLASTWLLVKDSIWNWVWGIVSSALYVWVFYVTGLYSSGNLQLILVGVQCYGWRQWKRGGPRRDDDLPITLLSGSARVGWTAAAVLLCAGLGYAMAHTRAVMSYWDATLFGASIVAMILQARKNFENWIFWIVIDVLSLYVYGSQKLYVTTVLYLVFVLMGIAGAMEWRRLLSLQNSAALETGAA